MEEFKVNEYITLRLEDGKTNIYVGGKLFNHCKYVLMRKTIYELEDLLENIESVDELAEHLDHSLHDAYPEEYLEFLKSDGIEPEVIDIPAETQFWVHKSNMQVWAENNYDTRFLHSNLAFPLLKKLSEPEIGDPNAIRVFKEEIAKRLDCGHKATVMYLINEGYLNYLDRKKLDSILEHFDFSPFIGKTVDEAWDDEFAVLHLLASRKNKRALEVYKREIIRVIRDDTLGLKFYHQLYNPEKYITYEELIRGLVEPYEADIIIKLRKHHEFLPCFDINYLNDDGSHILIKNEKIIGLRLEYEYLETLPSEIAELKNLEILYIGIFDLDKNELIKIKKSLKEKIKKVHFIDDFQESITL